MRLRFLVAFLVACLLTPVAVMAQALADRVPDDAVLYIGWNGSDNLGAAFAQSHLKAVLDSSEMPAVFHDFLPKVVERIGREDRQVGDGMKLALSIAGPMWRHPCALYFGGLDNANPNMPMPRLGIICDAGADAPALLAQAQAALKQAPPSPLKIEAKSAGTFVMISLGSVNWGEQGKPAAALADAKSFKNTLAKVSKSPVCVMYGDVEKAMVIADQLVAMAPDAEFQAMWPKIVDATGLKGVKQFVCASGFDGQDWCDEMFVAAPGPRAGVVALFDSKPLDDDILKVVPQSAALCSAGRFDLARVLTEVRTAAGKIDPNAQQALDGGLEQVRQMLGMDIQNDLLGALGDEWVIYTDASVGGRDLMGFVVVNKLRDAAKAEKSLGQLEATANQLIKQEMHDPKITLAMRQSKVGDLTIHYLGIPMVAPAWTIKDGNLYVALYPQIVAAAASHTPAKSILDNPQFVALQKRVAGGKATGVNFIDLPQTAGSGYGEMLVVSRLFLGFGDLFGVQSPMMAVPSLDKLLGHLAPAGGAVWIDEAGFHSRSLSPFPGSTMLVGSGAGLGMMQQEAIMISTLLPALNRARDMANKVKCSSNMRRIGLAMQMYANDHKGKFPNDLGVLVVEEDITPEVFVCPSSDNEAPRALATPDARKAWVNAHSSYVYMGAGLTNSADADTIVLYEKAGNHDSDGMNLLYADGHAEWKFLAVAQREINRSKSPKHGNGGL